MRKLDKKVVNEKRSYKRDFVSNPFDNEALPSKMFTKRLIDLYEKQSDIKKFSKLVLEEEITDEFLDNVQAELMLKDVFNPFNSQSYEKLAQNENLLNDLAEEA